MKNLKKRWFGQNKLVSVSMTEYMFVISCGFWSCDTGRVTAAATATIMYICQGQVQKHSAQLETIHKVKVLIKSTIVL